MEATVAAASAGSRDPNKVARTEEAFSISLVSSADARLSDSPA